MNEANLIIHKRFKQSADEHPDKIALQIKKDNLWIRFSYKEVKELSLKVGAFLIGKGFKQGDFAALILENRPEWAAIYLGIVSSGAGCVPINPELSQQEFRNLILDSGVKIIFSSYRIFVSKLQQALEGIAVSVVVLDGEDRPGDWIDFSELKNTPLENIVWPEVKPSDVASLIYTSGTTAKPKGVLLSHGNICANFNSIDKLKIVFASDNGLSILPLYHSYAFMVTLIVPLFLGAKVTYCLSFRPQEIDQIIREAEVAMLVGVPQLFALLDRATFEKIKKIPFPLRTFFMPLIRAKLAKRFGSLRLLVSGGARLQPEVNRRLSGLGFKLVEGYGLTETAPVVTLNPPQKTKIGSVGKAVPDVEIKIFNPDKSGIGQVIIKGPNVMPGYFKQPDLTNQVIKDSWFYSGDFGFLDKEGYLFLVGRKEEIIVLSSGKNIYPEELEDYYAKSPFIKEICILSKQEKSFGSFKESLFAVIVPNLEILNQKDRVNIYEKIRWDLETLGKDLPAYKHIMGFVLTKEELPRTALKKLKRYEVAKKYLSKEVVPLESKEMVISESDAGIVDKEIAEKIIRYLSKELKRPVNLDSHLEIDLGIDSLTRVELGLGLEAVLRVKISDKLIYSVSTVRDIVISVQGLLKSPQAANEELSFKQKTWEEVLTETPRQEILNTIRVKPRYLDRMLTWIFQKLFRFTLRVFWLLRIKGRENLPKQGPYLICPNHASYLDGLVIFSSLPFDSGLNIFFLGLSYIFNHPSISWGAKVGRLIPIDASAHLTDAMQAVSFVLSKGKIACLFPEGMRSIDENVQEFKKGVGILIKELDIPVVPAYISGSHYAWPRGRRFPRPYPLKVTFGKPLALKDLISEGADDYLSISRKLREKVLELKSKVA